MLMATVFDRFVAESPLTVMARALLEHALLPGPLDEMFERTATVQYTDTLLFSTVVDVMGLVVCGFYASPHAVHVSRPELFPVTLKCFYEKLNGIELPVMRQMVLDNAAKLRAVIQGLGDPLPELLPGFIIKILDGNCLAGTQHRLKALREIGSAALPGKTLVVLDPQLGLVTDVFPCEDGHAQERALLGPVLDSIQEGELWIEDRNFCTLGWLSGVVLRRKAHVLVREHKGLPWTAVDEPRFVGRVETGEVWEQKVRITAEDGSVLELRRIIIKLDKPTRDGEMELALLTDLTVEQADALTLARLYLERWQIETAFQVLTEVLQCEQPRQGYPKAALFAFCVTLVAYNILAVIKAALRAVHGADKIEAEVSLYHVTNEIRRTHAGMMIAIVPQEWRIFRNLSAEELANALRNWASNVDLRKYKKAPTRPKKPKKPRQYDPKHPHVSTAKVLAERQRR
jgi:Transposase DDE domain